MVWFWPNSRLETFKEFQGNKFKHLTTESARQYPSVATENEKPCPWEAIVIPNTTVCNNPIDKNYPYITFSTLKKIYGDQLHRLVGE